MTLDELTNRYVLMRHGESEANVSGLIASDPDRGTSAFGLTTRGREQVAASVEAWKRAGGAADRIVASPLLRARQTAEIAAGLLGAPIEIDARLRERHFGTLDGGPDSAYARVWARDREDPSHADWAVERATDVLARAGAFVADVERESRDRTLLLCTHGDVASILACALLGRPLAQHRDVAALGVAEIRPLR
jgi:probable phosphoglycerate mutase